MKKKIEKASVSLDFSFSRASVRDDKYTGAHNPHSHRKRSVVPVQARRGAEVQGRGNQRGQLRKTYALLTDWLTRSSAGWEERGDGRERSWVALAGGCRVKTHC